jgi:hypothetical protein
MVSFIALVWFDKANSDARALLAIAFRHQKLALGPEALKTLHDKIPDRKKREESWENITKGIESLSSSMPCVFSTDSWPTWNIA